MEPDQVAEMFERQLKIIREERDQDLARLRFEVAALRENNQRTSRALYLVKGAAESLRAYVLTVYHELDEEDANAAGAVLDDSGRDLNDADSILGIDTAAAESKKTNHAKEPT